MANCTDCGRKFNISEARDEFNSEYGNGLGYDYYDDEYDGEVCARCAIETTGTHMAAGEAILNYNDMVHGEIPYDPDAVNRL
jgi:hypothetical protein